MKLSTDQKQEIQTFVYFLFRGHLDPRLINTPFNYLDKLLNDVELLYNCFEIFAWSRQSPAKNKHLSGDKVVADYIVELCEALDTRVAEQLVAEAKAYNKTQQSYWTDFLTLARWYCFNIFPDTVEANYSQWWQGNGSDSVPVFAIWTNVVEIDDNLVPLNSGQALKRANERMKLAWDKIVPSTNFEDWEVDQEIW